MPYLVKVGYYVQENRLTSQGYYIRRVGSKVITQWSGIYVKSNPTIKLFWKNSRLQSKSYPCGTPKNAKEFMQEKIEYFLKRKFDKLPSGYKIYPRKYYKT